jgi:hypothetical protein
MKKTKSKLTLSELPVTYEGLVRHHMPRYIHDQAEYDNTCEVADLLALPAANGRLNADQEDYYFLLCDLIEAWDKEQEPALAAPGR